MENKIATTIEQSKKLIELGIDENTADMYWWHYEEKTYLSGMYDGEFNKWEEDVPAWSLSALMGILPAGIKNYTLHIIKDNVIKGYFCSYRNKKNEVFVSTSGFNVIDAVLKMIVYLKENKLI